MVSSRTMLTRLLDRGFYPVELPPLFQTRGFSDVRRSLVPNDQYHGSTTFFDGATFRGALRTFGVINPINYMLLSRFIANDWTSIQKIFRLSRSSGARPRFPVAARGGRAIEVASLAGKRRSQRHLASAYPVIVSLDINRFYGAIYTHSIPWAVLGKEEAKSQHKARTLNGHWSDTLDRLVRNSNQQQTIGLAIGPDTSRIVSELILSRIDRDLTSMRPGLSSSQIYHNIDDYQIGVMSLSDAENAQSYFARTISKYELKINDFKTSIDFGVDFTPSNFQRYFDVLRDQSGIDFVEHFFDLLYKTMSSHPEVNVVGYVLKRFAKHLARNIEQDLVREYLQRLIFAAPHHARWVMPILLGIYRRSGTNEEISRIVAWGFETCVRRNDVGSLLWFLYSAIFLKINLSKNICEKCVGLSNALVDLMLFHGKSEGLFAFSAITLRRRYRESDFRSPSWLPLYEVSRRGWDTSAAFNKIGSDDDVDGLYDHFRNNGVEFYVADADRFTVESFDGWDLEQGDFEGGLRWDEDAPFNTFDDWENYE